MSDAIWNRLMDAIGTQLATITVANGYTHDIDAGRIIRAWPNETLITIASDPSLYYFSGPAQLRTISFDAALPIGLDVPAGEQGITMELNIVGLIRTTEAEREHAGIELYADVEQCMAALDATVIAGTAVQVSPRAVEVYTAAIYGTTAGFHAQLDVTFTTVDGLPRMGTA